MRLTRSGITFSLFVGAVAAVACSTTPSSAPPTGPVGLTCSTPGEATAGPADTHCVDQTFVTEDGGSAPVQPVNYASCFPEAGATSSFDGASSEPEEGGDGGNSTGSATDDGGAEAASDCDYGATMFGPGMSDGGGPTLVEGDDDDCKYHVSWTSTPICESSVLGVTFTVTVTYLGTNTPVSNIPAYEGVLTEAFIPTTLDAACDTVTTHASPTPFAPPGLLQTTPTSGVYVGSVIFDRSGEWTLRFHIHEECSDMYDDSPHGHAAFHVTVP